MKTNKKETTVNPNLLIADYNPLKREIDYRCGNSKFSDDVWDFKGFIDAPQWNDAKFRINFTQFDKWNSIRTTVKQYISSELLMNGFNSVKRKYAAFKQLVDFLNEHPTIHSFEDFSNSIVREYFQYVLSAKSVKGKPLSPVSIKKSAQVVKELLIRGGIRNWAVPQNTSKVNSLYEELIINNKRIKKGTKFGPTKKVLPEEEIVSNLLKLARDQVQKGEDILTCASIILSSQLGLRISEVVLLRANCLKVINGEYQIIYTTSKTKKHRKR